MIRRRQSGDASANDTHVRRDIAVERLECRHLNRGHPQRLTFRVTAVDLVFHGVLQLILLTPEFHQAGHNYLPSNLSTMKMMIAPDKLPPSSKYNNDQPAAAITGNHNPKVNMVLPFLFFRAKCAGPSALKQLARHTSKIANITAAPESKLHAD